MDGEIEAPVALAVNPAPARRGAGWRVPAWAWGGLAALALGAFYLATVALASRSWQHTWELLRDDRYYILAIAAGFGTQVGLTVNLRRALRGLSARAAYATGGAGTGASTLSMLACCAHHVSDLAPVLAGSGLVIFLNNYRYPVMLAGIAVNLLAVFLLLRRMRGLGLLPWQAPNPRPDYPPGSALHPPGGVVK